MKAKQERPMLVDFLDFYTVAGGALRPVPKFSEKTEKILQDCRVAALSEARKFVEAKSNKDKTLHFVRAVTIIVETNAVLARAIDNPRLAETVEEIENAAKKKLATKH